MWLELGPQRGYICELFCSFVFQNTGALCPGGRRGVPVLWLSNISTHVTSFNPQARGPHLPP